MEIVLRAKLQICIGGSEGDNDAEDGADGIIA